MQIESTPCSSRLGAAGGLEFASIAGMKAAPSPALPSSPRMPRRTWRSTTTECRSCSMILNSMTGYWMRFTPDQAAAMTKPYAGGIEAWEVGPVVGNVRNNRPDLMDRVRLLYACNVRFASEVGHWCSPKASQGRHWNKLPGEVRGPLLGAFRGPLAWRAACGASAQDITVHHGSAIDRPARSES
jgi:hypothetical protein